MPVVLFDDALPTLVRILAAHGGAPFVEQGTILRDATGRLTFFSRDPLPAAEPNDTTSPGDQGGDYCSSSQSDPLAKHIVDALGAYARPDRPVVYPDESGASPLLDSPERIPVQVGDLFCRLIDRRIVGAGWLAEPSTTLMFPPRLVFASLKGGVGRSTALTVVAADLARRNRNVLVVDLDLEAPGLGHLMLDDDRSPEYGVIDFLVENGVGGVDDDRLATFVGTSQLTGPDGGRVDVMPAIGRRSAASPENVIAKLSRAMLEDVDDNGSVSVGQQVSLMIERVAARGSYDAVLIDSRAGLAELAAPAVTGLGATVLLFGTAQTQTIEGYRALFSALQLLAQRDRMSGHSAEWRTALRPVYAKASLNVETEERFRDDLYELYSEYLYDAEDEDEGEAVLESLRFTRDDKSAPHWPLVIPFNQAFVEFDPARVPGQLTAPFYEQSFRPLLDAVDDILASASAETES
ncbi:cellulose biosynthesis protein BcsQ [Variovorax boronicumulans]|uniref:ParA family protein n=1 Tax=Variovorax boronicumulans TaxID=436515 RepID=UPI00278AD4BE|nr:AAA family ATPase [Variovorax boronicumulans]MDP9908252.1 cellulose biosynthesis protein BcsQ [Variovorax boronicumulans]